MAQASISLDHEQFICPICLDVLKDPVAVPCGHSYCMSCIEGCWDKNDPTRSYSCPQCRQTFTSRPFLGKNTALAEVVEKLKKTGLISAPAADCYAGPGDVPCDFCIVEKRRASKTCLMCLASYCEAHLQPHYQVPALKKHKLVKAIAQLQEKICPRHDKLMEVYCRTDQTCICYECSMDEHKDHDTVSAATECIEKQKQLGDTQNEYQERIRYKEWDLQALKETVETLRVSVHVAMEDSDRILTDFTHSIEKRRSAVKELIREQGKATQNHAEEMQERLGLEIAELREKVTELEQLSKTEDHIHFLQRFQSLCAPLNASETPSTSAVPVSDFWPIKKVLSELKQSLDSVSNDEWLKSSKAANVFAGPKARQEFLQYSSLAEVVEKLKKTGLISAPAADCYAGPGDVPCDFCIVEKRRASKTCLMCLASYCEAHLQPHYQVPALKKHKLVKAIAQLQEKICPRHDKLMEVYCRTDQTCICCECSMDEHKDHDTVSAATECMEKQKQLGHSKRQYQQRIQERERKLQQIGQTEETLLGSACLAIEESDRIFNELAHSIEGRCCELKEFVREQKASLGLLEEVQERLELEIDELRKRVAELEQLSETEDHIHFLQRFQSLCAPLNASETPSTSAVPVLDFWTIKKVLSELKQRLDSVSSDDWLKSSRAAIPAQIEAPLALEPRTREEFLQYYWKLTLDFNTAHKFIEKCNGPNWVMASMRFNGVYPDHPERLSFPFSSVTKAI
ncbi:hypothetical protein AGOR_G00190760 [Albula goreensis]|uniref:E3 ubiquitin/ISG15 ligase TRIM25-like n=1 Tax=Albula goreensis TaxID=1534307 RepID=A0A8T3CU17_9TELE|nr:hypothetical protein AGOR_G00190760 [Albula goreensis]